jgi:hypothetical protein
MEQKDLKLWKGTIEGSVWNSTDLHAAVDIGIYLVFPCFHAISAIYIVGRELVAFIAPCYSIYLYDKVYNYVLQPGEGKESWPLQIPDTFYK